MKSFACSGPERPKSSAPATMPIAVRENTIVVIVASCDRDDF
jgi:hypothetical protein